MLRIGPFPGGMNNRAKDGALPDGTARNIVNADIDAQGKAKRRQGITKVSGGMSCHSGFSCPAGSFFVDQGSLLKFTPTGTMHLISGIQGEVAYLWLNSTLYLTDGVKNWMVEDGVAKQWGMDVPAAPILGTTGGSLPPGRYLAAVSYVDADGLESGASRVVDIQLSATRGIVFQGLSGKPTRLYLSTANGTEMYLAGETAGGHFPVTGNWYEGGNTLDLLQVSPPPPGRMLAAYAGRIYIADANGFAWYSEPFGYSHFRLADSFLLWPGPVTLMEPVTGGIFFATDKQTWFYAGTPEDGFQIIEKFDYGAIRGTSVRNRDGSVYWQSTRGMIIATPDGEARNVQEANVAPGSATAGSAVIAERDGLRQFITSLQQPTASPLAATSWIDAEIIRRGQ